MLSLRWYCLSYVTVAPFVSQEPRLASTRKDHTPRILHDRVSLHRTPAATQLKSLRVDLHTFSLFRLDGAIPPCRPASPILAFIDINMWYLANFASMIGAVAIEQIRISFFTYSEHYPRTLHRQGFHVIKSCFEFELQHIVAIRSEIKGALGPSYWRHEVDPPNWLTFLNTLQGAKSSYHVAKLRSIVSVLAQVTGENSRDLAGASRPSLAGVWRGMSHVRQLYFHQAVHDSRLSVSPGALR